MATEGPDYRGSRVRTIDANDVDASEILGSAVERREDPALLTGDAKYTDDIQRPNMVHMALTRSPHGHARVVDVDTSEAEAMDGVVGVYTGIVLFYLWGALVVAYGFARGDWADRATAMMDERGSRDAGDAAVGDGWDDEVDED